MILKISVFFTVSDLRGRILAALTSVVTRESKLMVEPRDFVTLTVPQTRPETMVSMAVVTMLLNKRPCLARWG